MMSECQKNATIKVTGLIGIRPKMYTKVYSSLTESFNDDAASRFVTFELDLDGK